MPEQSCDDNPAQPRTGLYLFYKATLYSPAPSPEKKKSLNIFSWFNNVWKSNCYDYNMYQIILYTSLLHTYNTYLNISASKAAAVKLKPLKKDCVELGFKFLQDRNLGFFFSFWVICVMRNAYPFVGCNAALSKP